MNVIQHCGIDYPAFQAGGNAARFVRPFAEEVCKGRGVDVGCNRVAWCFPGAIPVDPAISPEYDAMRLPAGPFDYIFSSHCLEHLPDWVAALDYWWTCIRSGGHLFLYLPHPDQTYWRPWHNRKHLHCIPPDIIRAYLHDKGWQHVFVSERDLLHSYAAVATRQPT